MHIAEHMPGLHQGVCHTYFVSVTHILWVSRIYRRCHTYFAGVVCILQVSSVFCGVSQVFHGCHTYFVGVTHISWVSCIFHACRVYFAGAVRIPYEFRPSAALAIDLTIFFRSL